MDVEETVRWLRDREMIRSLAHRYAYGLDTRDFDVTRAVFHDDCQVKGTVRVEHISSYLPYLAEGVQRYDATMHFMGNQYVDVEPGADRGRLETYAVAYHMEPAGSEKADLIMGVRYRDSVVRDGDEWVIAEREVIPQWVRGPIPTAADTQ